MDFEITSCFAHNWDSTFIYYINKFHVNNRFSKMYVSFWISRTISLTFLENSLMDKKLNSYQST